MDEHLISFFFPFFFFLEFNLHLHCQLPMVKHFPVSSLPKDPQSFLLPLSSHIWHSTLHTPTYLPLVSLCWCLCWAFTWPRTTPPTEAQGLPLPHFLGGTMCTPWSMVQSLGVLGHLGDRSHCSTHGAVNPFSSYGPPSNSSIGHPMPSPIVGC